MTTNKTELFEFNKVKLIGQLHQLNSKCKELCERNPEQLNWAQIEEMGYFVNSIKEIME